MKSIRSRADLATHGAPSTFADPLHVGRPNIGNRETFLQSVGRILNNQWLTNDGPMVQEFEQRIPHYLSVKHCVAMRNGTIALEIAIPALGPEGEVSVPSWTFVATAHSLYWQGITPVFADIGPTAHNLDPDAVRHMITPRISGFIGVHLWGRAAPIDELKAIANEHGLKLVFNAAQAFGTYKGQSVGRFCACGLLSFHTTLAPGVHVSGNVYIGQNVYVGPGASIINGRAGNPLIIGDGAVIAVGACVTKSVEAGAMAAGVPALRKH